MCAGLTANALDVQNGKPSVTNATPSYNTLVNPDITTTTTSTTPPPVTPSSIPTPVTTTEAPLPPAPTETQEEEDEEDEEVEMHVGVTPGAFCKYEGALGRGKNGGTYTCKRSSTDSRLRWRK